ncbi:MAG: hypothetical protein M3417_10340 [Actinomycetota bacterium]|nr:hypothetical protein [Actinomycetota bacterium]
MNSNDTASPLEYLRAIRQRWRFVVLMAAITAGVALAVSLSGQKQYDASVELLLRGQEPIDALLQPGGSGGSSDPERDLNTEVQLIKVAGTANEARRKLGIDRSAGELLDQVETETSSTSNIVTLTVRDTDPRLAAGIADAFAEAYVEVRVKSARERYSRAAQLAQQQLLQLSPKDRRTSQGLELQARQRELRIAGALQTGGAEIVRRASIPTSASRPRPKLSGAVGLLLGLLLGVGLALARDLVDRRFKNESSVETFLELPILAAIPRPARRGRGLEDPGQREAYGLLAANLRLSRMKRGSRVLMVTSSDPSEGKTSVTFGVARACARLGLRVIAIEADLRHPSFARFTDVSSSAGLAGVLDGSSMVASALIRLDVDTLQSTTNGAAGGGEVSVLPAGALPDNTQQVLSDPGIGSTIEVARSMADVVLIDTAPVGTVNDAVALTSLVDGVLLVVRLNQTTKEAGRRALRVMNNVDAPLDGVVLTDAGAAESSIYYTSPSELRDAPGTPKTSAGAAVDGRQD